ncbi:MAG: hypothetical protein K2K54_06705 [Lachnospiraceae bacterium]|nr:hypothetical protein [Lachnospiraceae bacterium]
MRKNVSAIPYRSGTKSISASISGPTFASDTVELDPKCHLFGSAACDEGGDFGNPCYWTAKQYGDLAMTATLTAASFGADTSYTDIMAQSRMVSDNILHSYEKQAALFKTYRRANTRLYY